MLLTPYSLAHEVTLTKFYHHEKYSGFPSGILVLWIYHKLTVGINIKYSKDDSGTASVEL